MWRRGGRSRVLQALAAWTCVRSAAELWIYKGKWSSSSESRQRGNWSTKRATGEQSCCGWLGSI